MEKNFVVDQKTLLNLLSSIQPIVSKKTALESTSYILFQVGHKELILKSTDLEISLQSSCSLIDSTFENHEAFLVPGKRIFDIIKELQGPIHCSLYQNQLHLKSNSFSLSLNIKEADEFPPFPERIENIMQIDATSFFKMLESVVFLIPQNNANPALNGLFLEIKDNTLFMTTTDGHCLAQVSSFNQNYDSDKSWLLPKRAVYELKKILESLQDKTIFLGTCSNQLVFSGELFNFFTKILADQFPHYKTILDKVSFQCASIDKNLLLKALRRSSCLLSGQFIPTSFSFDNDQLNVTINNKEVGSLSEQLTLSSALSLKIDIKFYAPYILNGLQAFDNNNINFYLKGNLNPIIFESATEENKTTYLVMPISSN